MFFFNNIFAASYKFYSKFENEPIRFSATAIVSLCQSLLSILLLGELHERGIIHIPNKYYALLIGVCFVIINYSYYSKKKIESILDIYEKKSSIERQIWTVIAIISVLLPIILIAITA